VKKNSSIPALLLIIFLVAASPLISVSRAQAQSVQLWSDPINLSISGSATNPYLVVDSKGIVHTFWFDSFAGYQYAESIDGITWSAPVAVKVPFDKYVHPPVFISDATGRVHIFWTSEKNSLMYAQVNETSLAIPANWRVSSPLDLDVYDFDAFADVSGKVHVSYVRNPATPSDGMAGVYYMLSQNGGIAWEPEKLLFESPYFRSIDETSAHVRIVASNDPNDGSVYSVWDDRSQKRIFMGISRNGGRDWEPIREVIAPDPALGSQTPFGSDINVLDNNLLLTWQLGSPGASCALYSRSSVDSGESWDEPNRFLAVSAQCPERTEFLSVDPRYAVMLMTTDAELSLIAWNGSVWSNPEPQSGPSSISNPATFEPVTLGCQNVLSSNSRLYVVGCNEGGSSDIWFISRELDPMESLFPLPSAWAQQNEVTRIPHRISFVSSVSDSIGDLHLLWIRSAASAADDYEPRFEYSHWNGNNWSQPAPVLTDLGGLPIDPALAIDAQEKLLLTWVNANTGDLWFSWANSARANIPLEWAQPVILPSPSDVNESPSMVVDAAGRIVVAYAVAINENRGIYVTQSTDLGATWSPPQLAFDAVEADWDRIDQPKLTFTEDGVLHLLFTQYSARMEEETGTLYYSQSADGGTTWSVPFEVTANPVKWSTIASVPGQGLHRFWQEVNRSVTSTHHQVSTDGGLTWSAPVLVSSEDTLSSVPSVVPDWTGNIHLLQTSLDEFEYLHEWSWSNSRWQLVETRKISIPTQNTISTVHANLTANGKLYALFQSEHKDANDELESEITGLGRSLELSGTPPLFSTLITAPRTAVLTNETPVLEVTAVGPSPLDGLEDASPVLNRNVVGLVLVVLVVLVILVLVIPSKKK
jgi:hypothetical protein